MASHQLPDTWMRQWIPASSLCFTHLLPGEGPRQTSPNRVGPLFFFPVRLPSAESVRTRESINLLLGTVARVCYPSIKRQKWEGYSLETDLSSTTKLYIYKKNCIQNKPPSSTKQGGYSMSMSTICAAPKDEVEVSVPSCLWKPRGSP